MISTRTHRASFVSHAGALVSARTARHLADVAQFLATHNPTGEFTERGRMTAVLVVTRTAEAAAPVLRKIAFPEDHITRGEAAVQINATARKHGCAWTGDDGEDQNAPAIPRYPNFPGPRPASDPLPAGPVKIPRPSPEQAALAPRPLPCPDCFGEGGETVVTGFGVSITETFNPCTTCKGTGVRS